jgi:phage protein D
MCHQVHRIRHRVVLALQYKDLVEGRGKHAPAKGKKANVVEQKKAQEKEVHAALKQQQADEKAKKQEEEQQRKKAIKEERCCLSLFLQGKPYLRATISQTYGSMVHV